MLLISVSEVGVLKVCEILESSVLILNDWALGIAELVPSDEHVAEDEGDEDLAGDAADDELAAGLVDGGFGAEEAVGADDVADTVGLGLLAFEECDVGSLRTYKEYKGCGSCTLGVTTNVGGGHLKGDNKSTDERSALITVRRDRSKVNWVHSQCSSQQEDLPCWFGEAARTESQQQEWASTTQS